jgi:hypothetical protein
MFISVLDTFRPPVSVLDTFRPPVSVLDTFRALVSVLDTFRPPVSVLDTFRAPVSVLDTFRAPVSVLDTFRPPVSVLDTFRLPVSVLDTFRAPVSVLDTFRAPVTVLDTFRAPVSVLGTFRAPVSVLGTFRAPISFLRMFRAPVSFLNMFRAPVYSVRTCMPDGHLHRVTYTRFRIHTIDSPDDGHMAARNMQRVEINLYKKLSQVGYLQELYRDAARSAKQNCFYSQLAVLALYSYPLSVSAVSWQYWLCTRIPCLSLQSVGSIGFVLVSPVCLCTAEIFYTRN